MFPVGKAGGTAQRVGFGPCSAVWPMGFAWSSCVAQDTLLALCDRSGLTDILVLAPDAIAPVDLGLAFAVATDDLMIFSDAGPQVTVEAARRVEHTMLQNGVLKKPGKDVDDVTHCPCVGVELIGGTRWFAPGQRLWSLLDAVIEVVACRRASPGSVAAFIGVAQWFDLLRRLRLSVFNNVYDFASGCKAKDWLVFDIPPAVFSELLLVTVLAPFGVADMS